MRIPRDCFPNLVAALSHDIRASVVRIFTCRELVAKVLKMFKNWMRIFFPKYFARLSRDCHATVARCSCECREPVAAKFWRIYNAKFSRPSYKCRVSVVRIKIKIRYIRGKVVRHSHECRATVARYILKIRPKFANVSHKCLFNETAT